MQATTAHWDEVWSKTHIIAPHDTVLRAVESLGVRTVLEVGAGSGRDLSELHARGLNVTFSDFSETAVAAFRGAHDGVRADRADARALPYADSSFDLVLSLGLIEHFDEKDRIAILREKFRVSSRYVLVDVPQRLSPMFLVKRSLMAVGKWPYGEETEFSYGSLLTQVQRAVPGAAPVSSYGREIFPLPRNFKQKTYGRLPDGMQQAYVGTHRWFARGLAGSFGVVFEVPRGG